jgi:ABC-2 type transport system permease protein
MAREMKLATRYARILAVQLRLSVLLSLQYRADFISDGVTSLFWLFFNVAPLLAAFHYRQAIAGWTLPQALLVLGFFTLLKGILDGAINPSLAAIVDQIRKGTLDYALLKPIDSQFLLSTARFEPWKTTDVLAGFALLGVALFRQDHRPGVEQLALSALLLLAAIVILYSLWIFTVCAAFYVVRLDNLAFLFSSVFDLARWPIGVFRGGLRLFFTLVIPLALMTTYPAMALLGLLSARTALLALLGTAVFFTLSRLLWSRSILNYSSASS